MAISAPVGEEELGRVLEVLRPRDVDASLLSVLAAPTYRWSARQAEGSNLDLGGRDSIYDGWTPRLPDSFSGWAFVGSMRPDRQAEAAEAMFDAFLLAGDSMRSYVASLPQQAQTLLEACDWFFSNEEELRALGGDPDAPDGFRREHGLEGLVVKSGPRGASAWTEAGGLAVPALPGGTVVDVTGAGDALAGGFLARWLATGGNPDGLQDALQHGAACAALAISDIGLRGIARATPADLEALVGRIASAGGRSVPPETPIS